MDRMGTRVLIHVQTSSDSLCSWLTLKQSTLYLHKSWPPMTSRQTKLAAQNHLSVVLNCIVMGKADGVPKPKVHSTDIPSCMYSSILFPFIWLELSVIIKAQWSWPTNPESKQHLLAFVGPGILHLKVQPQSHIETGGSVLLLLPITQCRLCD